MSPVRTTPDTPLPAPVGTLVVRRGEDVTAAPYYEGKWRASADQRQVKRRLGPAWLESAADGGWRPRRGRVRAGYLDERRAHVELARLIAELELTDAENAQRNADAERSKQTFGALCRAWLHHQEHVKRVKPSTLRDLESVLAAPGTPSKRGGGLMKARVLRRFDDVPAGAIKVEQIDAFLDEIATEGISVRSVNRYREVLRAVFNFGISRRSAFGLTENPAAESTLRRENGPRRLEVFDVEQVEALARTAASGKWRSRTESSTDDRRRSSALWARDEATLALERDEDQQLAELLRVASYTGLRRGELVALRWRDVRWRERVLVVERAISHGVEVAPKSGRARYVPLADQPLAALERLSRRENFTSDEDFVFANVVGDPLDASALRRRYVRVRDAAGLPPLRFHDLRHTAGSLLVREIDPASVKDLLGHADMKTTQRYLHAKRASSLAEAATKAFATTAPADPTERARQALRVAFEALDIEEVRALVEVSAPRDG